MQFFFVFEIIVLSELNLVIISIWASFTLQPTLKSMALPLHFSFSREYGLIKEIANFQNLILGKRVNHHVPQYIFYHIVQ